MTIEANIRQWLLLAAPGAAVNQAPYEGPRPTTPYLTYQVNAIAEQQCGWRTLNAAGVDTRYTSAIITVSVNAYADKGYQYLSNAKAQGDQWEARELLRADDIALAYMQGGSTNNLTGLGDTGYRSRYQCDVMFHADLTHARTRYLIDQWILYGSFTAADGSDVVPSSVVWVRPL